MPAAPVDRDRTPPRPGVLARAALPALLLVHLLAGSTAARPLDSYPDTFATDLVRIVEIVDAPGRAWRDVDVEYPPLLVAELELLGSDDLQATGRRLAWSQLLLHLVTVAAMAWGWGRRGATAYLALSLPFALYPFIFQRTDLLAIALAAIGAAAWRRGREVTGGAVLALAFFAKAWPAALGPGLLAAGRRRATVAWAAVLGVGTLAWIAYGGVGALSQVLTFRGATGAQIESLPANVLGLVSDVHWRVEQGAVRVGELPAWLRLALPAAGVALASLAWLLVARRHRAGRPDLAQGVGSLTAVAALLCTGTLLSTQFTAWLLPWAAVIAAELPPGALGRRGPVRLDVVLVGLTGAIAWAAWPLMWIHPDVGHGEAGLWLLTARNVALLAVLGTGLRRLAVLEPVDAVAPGAQS